MRVAIIGRTGTLIDTAHALAAAGHTVALVVTAKAAPEYAHIDADFRALADGLGAAFLASQTLDTAEFARAVAEAGPIDAGISLNYPTIIGQAAIDRFPLGILNAHGGDLPRYRGNACQAWALLNGEPHIGLCIHRMVGGELDSGDVIVRRHLAVTIDTRVGEVQAWMAAAVPGLFVEAVDRLRQPAATFERQDPAAALRCYPRRPEDGGIDWRQDDESILRLINASSEPYAGAFTSYKGTKLIVWRAALAAADERCLAVPGQVARIDREQGGVEVIAGRGRLRLLEVETDGVRGPAATLIISTRARLV